MEHKGRMEKQVDSAIEILVEEGTIVIPMDQEKYEEFKDYKFTIVEEIHKISKNINWQVQRRLFEAVKDKLERTNKKVTYTPDEGLIRLK